MTEHGTWKDYQRWDADRRARFGSATHWIYRSHVAGDTVAWWCPLTGQSMIRELS